MTATAEKSRMKSALATTSALTGPEALKGLRSNEIFVGIVGPAGSGSGTAAEELMSKFKEEQFEVELISASALIRKAALSKGFDVPEVNARKTLDDVIMLQDRGDELREGKKYDLEEDHSAVARMALKEIARRRAKNQNLKYLGDPVEPDGNYRAYIIYSLRHPAEATLFREAYREAFALLGIVCDPKERKIRIIDKYFEKKDRHKREVMEKVSSFLERDENSSKKYGQHVSDAFHEADFFVDNSKRLEKIDVTGMSNELSRFVMLMTQSSIVRPTIAETAMHHAHSARLRSACLSRQVGAALVDSYGNIVATGTNDVPRAGGGLYGEGFVENILTGGLEVEKTENEGRCAFQDTPYCSNNKEQNAIIQEMIEKIPDEAINIDKHTLKVLIRSTRIGGLLEFSRAVHAEMDAILSAAAAGISPRASRLFVSTFPCHYCARHIVASGIDEVQYIEPYPKSKAIELHKDSITTDPDNWLPPSNKGSHVLFRPFVGVAPRFYRKAFFKDRSYKDDVTGEYAMGESRWSRPTDIYKIPYPSIEAELGLGVGDD